MIEREKIQKFCEEIGMEDLELVYETEEEKLVVAAGDGDDDLREAAMAGLDVLLGRE